MKVFLMQGDSITDAHRDRSTKEPKKVDLMGRGYAYFTASALELKYPGEYTYLNRGHDRDRIVDLYARSRKDLIVLQPDVLSILIGVNDVLHEYTRQNGVDAEKFEMIYNMMMDEVQEALPNTKVILMGAFVMPNLKEFDYPTFRAEVAERAAITKKIADARGFKYVDLQALFDQAQARGVQHLTLDGIHPDYAGCSLIKNALVAAFEEVR